jgi:protein-S-isoprenylcysteine O-methyltransferase Ste14
LPSPHVTGAHPIDVHALQTAIAIAWVLFWIYWLASAFNAKEGRGGRRRLPVTGLTALSVVLLIRVFRGGSLAVHSLVLEAIGAVVFASGLALAIWARIHLGRNWGMPMTEKAEPELITSGPYRIVRHPIYLGLLLGVLGTALATDLIGLIIVAVLGGYFYYSASVEERNLTATFPTAYPAYRAATKMLIPFVL